jgi:hypothetical protein
MISYGLSLGGYGVYIQFSIAQLWAPGSISTVSSVNNYKSTKMKILSIICIRSFVLGRPSRDCSILHALWALLRVGLLSENCCIVLDGGRGVCWGPAPSRPQRQPLIVICKFPSCKLLLKYMFCIFRPSKSNQERNFFQKSVDVVWLTTTCC